MDSPTKTIAWPRSTTCVVCEERDADRTLTVEKPSRGIITFLVCAPCALSLAYERD